jgi:hypothetical protein
MLDEAEKNKGAIMAAIRCGESDEDILSGFHITSGTLKAIKKTFEKIETMLGELKPVSEIAQGAKCSEEFVEEVRRILSTDEDILIQEATREQTPEPQDHSKTKGLKGKDIDKILKKVGQEQSAAVLTDDAGDIAKGVTIQRQDIGKFVMEIMGTVAMQFGYKDLKLFLQDEHEFWVKNQGRLSEMEAQIEELSIINQQLQDALERDMVGVLVAKKMDGIICILAEKGTFDPEKLPQILTEYKKVLASDPVFLRQLYDSIHNIPTLNEGG